MHVPKPEVPWEQKRFTSHKYPEMGAGAVPFKDYSGDIKTQLKDMLPDVAKRAGVKDAKSEILVAEHNFLGHTLGYMDGPNKDIYVVLAFCIPEWVAQQCQYIWRDNEGDIAREAAIKLIEAANMYSAHDFIIKWVKAEVEEIKRAGYRDPENLFEAIDTFVAQVELAKSAAGV